MPSGRIISIESIDDPRIAAYTHLKERDLAREGDRFIAESEMVVRRLLQSKYRVESVLLTTRRVDEMEPVIHAETIIYTAPSSIVNQILGFKFHSGVMACGVRGPSPSLAKLTADWGEKDVNLVVCPELSNTENMGSMVRLAAAFGADAMVLGEQCCDPFYRQSVRVSMGTIFQIPILRSRNLLDDLGNLRRRWGVQLVATMLDPSAEPLSEAKRVKRMGFLFGNEAQGLTAAQAAICDRRVVIPMKNGTDSLNVSVAAGIVLYHFTQYAQASA